MKKLLNESEKEQIKLLYESKGILLFEETIWSILAKKAAAWVGKNEDDIALLLKTSEKTLAKSIDDIIEVATKSKSDIPLDDIQVKLMHIFNRSGAPENIPKAKQQMINFLNGFAKSKGKQKWQQIRDEVVGKVESSGASAASNTIRDMLKGQRISNNSFTKMMPDFTNILNAKNMNDYNKLIANAIKTGNYSHISSKGFEKFGIDDFRNYLKNNISKINEVDPLTGRWSVIFK